MLKLGSVICLGVFSMGYYLRGLDDETKTKLSKIGKAKFGTSVISKTVIAIINDFFNEEENQNILNNTKSILSENRVRVSATLFQSQYDQLIKICDERKITPSYFLKSCILKAIGRSYILDGNDLEQLRASNYSLTKIGININQIAKRINTMNSYENDDIRELNKLTEMLESHTTVVKELLERTQDKW